MRYCYFGENYKELFLCVTEGEFVTSLNTIWRKGRPKTHKKYPSVKIVFVNRTLFNWMLWNKNQTNHSDQSLFEGKSSEPANNSMQILAANASAGKLVCRREAIGFGFTSD